MANDNLVRILLVEDSVTSAEMVKFWLADGLPMPHTLHTVGTLRAGLKKLASDPIDLIVLDLNLPDSEGLDTFVNMHAHAGERPIVIMSSESDEEMAVSAVRQGAQDYVVKGSFADNPLARPVRYALERVGRQRAERELRKTQEQVFLARAVQQQLFPTDSPHVSGFDLAGRCEPAECTGGDYFDYFPMIGGKLGVVIGDVSGHGLDACMFMVGIRAAVRALVTAYGDVGFIVSRLNQILDNDLIKGRFVTLLFICLDPATRSLRYAAAGHRGLLLDAEGRRRAVLDSKEPPLGVDLDVPYQTSESVSLEPGETIVLVTDGVTERMDDNDNMYGEPRLIEVVQSNYQLPASHLVETIFRDVRSFARGRMQLDDVTALVVRRQGDGDEEGAE